MIETVELLAKPSAQLAYEASLTRAGHAPTELVSAFCDDLFHPRELAGCGEFTNDELKSFAHLYGLVIEVGHALHASVAAMLKDPLWRRVVTVANDLLGRLAAGGGRTGRCT
jgi:hypothetical protein